MNKEVCCKCKNMATWCYMPGEALIPEDDYFCDNHVPRGCSCNRHDVVMEVDGKIIKDNPIGVEGIDYRWIEIHKSYECLDNNGLRFPCCEFWQSVDGWEKE